jgi:two-component system cell cycle sensor histidine kinase/response regulator CckA
LTDKKKHLNENLDHIQNEYYQYLVNGSSFAIIGTDCQGIIINWNQMAEKIFDEKKEHMLGRHIENIIPKNRRKLINRLIEKTVIDHATNEFEIEVPDTHEKELTLAVVITPVTNVHQEILGLAAWVRDITNRKILEEQLAQKEKMASLGNLSAGIAHNFNNILGGVSAVVDFALQSDNPENIRRALKVSADSATRMNKITQSLLTFAEKDFRQFDLSDLTEVILSFAQLVEESLIKKNITLQLHLQSIPIYEIPGSRLQQLLGNLVDNAEAAMPNGGAIKIRLEQTDQEIAIIVTDTGAGIETANLPHIFDPFFSTRDVSSGGDQNRAGLGLSVVHGIVRELKGTIQASSKLNKGTTFIIHLPPTPPTDEPIP